MCIGLDIVEKKHFFSKIDERHINYCIMATRNCKENDDIHLPDYGALVSIYVHKISRFFYIYSN